MKICTTSTGNRRLAGIACLLLAGGVMTAATAEETAPAYTMSAIEDAAYGEAILAGDYATAIEGIASGKGDWRDRFYAENNLCVAYIMTRNLDSAAQSCDRAVTLAEYGLGLVHAGSWRYRKPALERYLALALSNRGVYLAVSGSTAAANDDFNAAMNLSARVDAPMINLERLARQVQPAA